MSTKNKSIASAKQNLFAALQTKDQKYMQFMKQWFAQKIGRDEFDVLANDVLQPKEMSLHNDFLVAIFNKCNVRQRGKRRADVTNQSTKKSKVSADLACFEQYDPMDDEFVSELDDGGNTSGSSLPVALCTKEGCLPDSAFLSGRLLLAAWEAGLQDVGDDAVWLARCAIEQTLKNIITAAVFLRRSYARRDGGFVHRFGSEDVPTYHPLAVNFRQSQQMPSVHQRFMGENVELKSTPLQLCAQVIPATKLSLSDVFQALKNDDSVLPTFGLHCIAMQRILSKLKHLSQNELDVQTEADLSWK